MDVYKKYISYDEYDKLICELVQKLKLENVKPTLVMALPRGGLAIGLHISHHLDCEDLFTLPINDDVAYMFGRSFKDCEILIVDDVCDSGKTLTEVANLLNSYNITNFKTATLHIKPRRNFEPDYFVKEVPDNCWLVYPWEKDAEPDKEYMK